MKLRISMIASLLLILTITVSVQAYTRTVMLEEFTSSTCPPCYTLSQWFAPYMNNLGWTNPQNIAYHMNWPSPGNDPWYAANSNDNGNRRTYYGVNGIPAIFVDGAPAQQPNYSPSQTQVSTLVNQRMAVASPLWFNLRPTVNAAGDSVIATLKVVANTPISGNYRLRMFIMERHEHWTTPAPNNQTDFDFPMCIAYPDGSGLVFAHSGLTSDTSVYRAAFIIRSTGLEPYTIDNAGVVAFVQNDGSSTKEVLQSAYAAIPLTSPSLNFVGSSATDVSGNYDGRIDPGETGSITVTLANSANFAPAVNLTGHLSTSVPGISVTDSVAVFGTVNGGSSGTNSAQPFQIQVSSNVPAQYATFHLNVTADTSGYTGSFTFQVRIGRPRVLLVEADSAMDVGSYYTSSLQNLGIDYDLWNEDSTALSQSELLSYNNCIWFTGSRHNNLLSSSEKAEMQAFIDAGKNLVFSSENALEWALTADSNFARDYLHATLVNDNESGVHQFNGVAGDPYFDNLFLRTVGAGGAGDADSPTSMLARGNAVNMLQYNGLSSYAGVYYVRGQSHVVFLGIPLEAVSGAASTSRDSVITRIMNFFGGTLSAPDHPGVTLPTRVELSEAFPNPFNPTTTVALSLPVSEKVLATIYDISGREVQRVFAGNLNAGTHSFRIDISHQPSGVYFLRVEANGVTSTRKLALLK